jgi:hypothetical protein
MKSRFSWTIPAILLRVFPILACGVGATVIPLKPCADAYPGNPMVHQSGTAIVDGAAGCSAGGA